MFNWKKFSSHIFGNCLNYVADLTDEKPSKNIKLLKGYCKRLTGFHRSIHTPPPVSCLPS